MVRWVLGCGVDRNQFIPVRASRVAGAVALCWFATGEAIAQWQAIRLHRPEYSSSAVYAGWNGVMGGVISPSASPGTVALWDASTGQWGQLMQPIGRVQVGAALACHEAIDETLEVIACEPGCAAGSVAVGVAGPERGDPGVQVGSWRTGFEW